LLKTGLIVANCRVVVQVGKRLAELEKRCRQMWNGRRTPNQISGVMRHVKLMLIGYQLGDQWMRWGIHS
jgi:hypothetical protein